MKQLKFTEFLPQVDSMLAHWESANAEAGAVEISVLDGVDRAALLALRGELAGKLMEMVGHENAMELAGGKLALLRREGLDRMVEFNAVVRAWWGESPLVGAVPRVPLITSSVDKFLEPMRRVLRLWTGVNSAPAPSGIVLPLMLGGGLDYPRSSLAQVAADLLAAREEYEEGEYALTVARSERDALELRIYTIMKAYAAAVLARLGPKSVAGDTLPKVMGGKRKGRR